MFVLKHKIGAKNRVADALSRRMMMLSTMRVEVVGLEKLKETYADCPDFGLIFNTLQSGPTWDHPNFVLQEGHLFHGDKLCIPRTSVHDFLM